MDVGLENGREYIPSAVSKEFGTDGMFYFYFVHSERSPRSPKPKPKPNALGETRCSFDVVKTGVLMGAI